MGRPPLNEKSNTKLTPVRLTEEMRAQIAALVGPNRMAEFIREAIEREIKRRSRQSKESE
ncbi:YlcI/YnfO family protein [Mesorhizobium sp. M0088]|uniref:YlcI/YnfO family protein n=1 Tax=Mesorhizobium sp. M0088 TaxID=2956873 RepID=UPI00333E043D